MAWLKNITLVVIVAAFFASCANNADVKEPGDTMTSGTIDISVDETFKPIIQEQLKVFDSSFPEAHINVHYKPESECLKDLLDEKARLILVTRQLTAPEKSVYEQKKILTQSLELAQDAIAVIVNPAAEDSMLSVTQLKGILTGQYKTKYTLVFDNQGSSTLRYITDSLLKGEKLGPNVYAAKGNDSVVDYVAKNPNAIGLIGVSYVSDYSDANTQKFLEKVKVASVMNDSSMQFYKPYQYAIGLKLYPLTRKLYFIINESQPRLGTAFVNFLSKERGQLIFSTSGLVPMRLSVVFREAEINYSK